MKKRKKKSEVNIQNLKDKNNKPDNQLKHDDNYILLNKSELNEIIKEAITQLKQLEDKPLTNYSGV